jgi:hypothetical protein
MKPIIAFVLSLAFVGLANAQLKSPTESAMDRFLRYVKIDTQSQEDQTTTPSTRKQLNLANLLAKELTALGAENVRVSEFGIVYASVPGNLADNSKVPVVGFIAHMDTSACRLRAKTSIRSFTRITRAATSRCRRDPTQVITLQEPGVERADRHRHHHS